jgi:hypothetical protein
MLPSHHCNGAGVRNGNPYRHSALYSVVYRAAIGPICIMARSRTCVMAQIGQLLLAHLHEMAGAQERCISGSA